MHIRICFLSALLPTVFLASGEEPSDSLVRELQEIVVTADQPATRLEGNVLVSTITGSNLQNLGTALDVLAQLPLMKVEDGAVSVAGKGIPDVYIDGRPMRDGDELRNLSSSDLKKVELLLAPRSDVREHDRGRGENHYAQKVLERILFHQSGCG